MTSSFLKIRDLDKQFGAFTALRDIDLDVTEGEFVCFLGPSGCGKTTLLRAIAGLDIQTRGTIEQAGKEISVLPPSERDFGIVFQSYALFPNLTVRQNIAYGLENRKMKRAAIRQRVAELLELIGLPEQRDKYPAQLSGGQQQRIALARALATSPGLLLLDEPLSALDAKVREHLRHEIKQLQQRLQVTTIMVTHDQEEALTMADRVVVMNHGVIEQVGTPMEIYRQPSTPFVADFIGAMNFMYGQYHNDGPRSGQVKLGTVDLVCPATALATDSAAIVAIRPEDIRVDETGADNTNCIPARLDTLEFYGSFFRAEFSVAGLDTPLRADLSVNLLRRTGIQLGEQIKVILPPDQLHVFSNV
jgi:iron(III) transport system ATP-binding protein